MTAERQCGIAKADGFTRTRSRDRFVERIQHFIAPNGSTLRTIKLLTENARKQHCLSTKRAEREKKSRPKRDAREQQDASPNETVLSFRKPNQATARRTKNRETLSIFSRGEVLNFEHVLSITIPTHVSSLHLARSGKVN